MDKNFISQQMAKWMQSLTVVDSCALKNAPSDIMDRDLHMNGIANARQLGGYKMPDGRTIKKNTLLRTANLHYATEEDCQRLAEEYHTSLIIDLRSKGEHLQAPDQKVEGAREFWANLMESSMDGLNQGLMSSPKFIASLQADPNPEMMTVYLCQESFFQMAMNEMYVEMLKNETSKQGFSEIFKEILAMKGGTILWHCAQGKDRCGMTSALLLGALGADFDQILDDFDISNIYYQNILAHNLALADKAGSDEATKKAIKAIIGVNRDAMAKAMDYIKENYGSVADYICQELGISEKDIDTLKEYYLDSTETSMV